MRCGCSSLALEPVIQWLIAVPGSVDAHQVFSDAALGLSADQQRVNLGSSRGHRAKNPVESAATDAQRVRGLRQGTDGEVEHRTCQRLSRHRPVS